MMKHVFWACWIQKTFMHILVLGWVVRWGATWGVAKFRSQWRWSKKIRKIENIHFVVRERSNMMIYAKKFELFGV